MRRFRPLMLLLIALLVMVLGGSYYVQSKIVKQNERAVPAPPPRGVVASAEGWSWRQMEGGRVAVEVHAKDFKQITEPARFELFGVDLRFNSKDGLSFDKVTSAKAQLDIGQGILFSEGDVEIAMHVKDEGQEKPGARLLRIQSSGVYYDTKTGKAWTDRPAQFTFGRGSGKAVGAAYDPIAAEVTMKNAVELNWQGAAPEKTMKVQAGDLLYKEKESKVYLHQWSKLFRGGTTLEGGDSVITLIDGVIRTVDAQKAHGSDVRPGRKVEYGAEQLVMNLDENGEIQVITGDRSAHVQSITAANQMTMTGNHSELFFDTGTDASTLTRAIATGQAMVESKPVPAPGILTPDTKVLRSEIITLQMKEGGEYIQSAETQAPGTLEFLPNRPGQRHRKMDADHLWVTYGGENRIQSFRAINVATKTDPLPRDLKDPKFKKDAPPPAPALTWSKELAAEYDPATGQLSRMEQNKDFRYQEGDRQAKAAKAVLDSTKDSITLDSDARLWDLTGSTSADGIVIDQKTNDFVATGNVNSTRLPDKKPEPKTAKPSSDEKAEAKPGSLLANDQPMQAKAAKMTSRENNRQIRYEGNALLWQGANRLQADRVDIDRKEQRLVAQGHVISQLVEQPKEDTSKPSGVAAEKKPAPVGGKTTYTVIRSSDLLYTDVDHVAYYTGGVLLNRPDMQVKSKELRAFLKQGDDGSSLDKAFADGAVDINQSQPGKVRRGSSEHAEYYVDDDKVLLTGGTPVFSGQQGMTRGQKLTYFASDDNLIVDGAEAQPAFTKIKKKK